MADEPTTNDGKPDENGAEPAADEPIPEIDFTTFILSLSSSAAFHLGIAAHPETGKTEINLPMAKQTIDILGILQDKTRGNLTGAEERLLGEILYNLRIAFVRAAPAK
jgi:hypothetical protein